MMALLLGQISKRLSLFWRLSMVAKPSELLTIVAATALLAPLSAFGQGLVGLTPDSSAASTQTTVAIDTQNPGVAVVSNGQRSGPNLYHRFDQFDTTKDNLNRVFFDMGTRGPDNVVNNMIVGVSSTSGSHISVPLVLSQPAALIFMSPYGITVSGQAGFGWGSIAGDISNLSTIVLTTANKLALNSTANAIFEAQPASSLVHVDFPDSNILPELYVQLSRLPTANGHIALHGPPLDWRLRDNAMKLTVPLHFKFEQNLILLDLNDLSATASPWNSRPVLVEGFVSFTQHSQFDSGLRGVLFGNFEFNRPKSMLDNEYTRLFLQGDIDAKGYFGVNAWTSLALNGSIVLENSIYLVNGQGMAYRLGPNIVRNSYFLEATPFMYPLPSVILKGGRGALEGGVWIQGTGMLKVENGELYLSNVGGDAIQAFGKTQLLEIGRDNNFIYFPDQVVDVPSSQLILQPQFSGLGKDSSIIVDGPIRLGKGGIQKLGFGRVVLTNGVENSYEGVTEVTGGHLQVNGPFPSIAYCNNASSNICDEQLSQSYWKSKYNPEADPDFLAYIRKQYGADPMAGVDPATYVPSFQEFSPAPPTFVSLGFAPSEQSIETSNSSQKEYIKSLQALAPELFHGGMPTTPSPQEIQAGMQRQVQRIRSLAIGSPQALLQDQSRDQSSWIASTTLAGSRSALPAFHAAAYQPAVVYLRFSEDHGPAQAAQPPALGGDSFLDFTLIPLEGPVQGIRVPLSKKLFFSQLRELYASLARQDRLDTANPASASRQLYQQLITPIVPFLEAKRVTTLLIAADQGLQAVPLAALHDGQQFFGERYAFSVTPSLALTSFNSSTTAGQPIFVAGSSQFDAMAPLPLVPQEVQTIGAKEPTNIFLNRNFTPEVFFEMAGDPHFSRVHVATHAEFLPGGPAASYIYSGVGPMPMSLFSRLRLMRKGAPLDLITLSACRTALGDPSSELGFAGMAIQAGARSAAGTLWYVDDVASSAFFMQMYRYLNQGVPKAEALQLTRQMFLRRQLHLEGDRLLSADGNVLLEKLDSVQQRRVHDGLDHPYFWAGIELAGSPW